jgi:hypothetical protein
VKGEDTARLRGAFPASLAEDVDRVARVLPEKASPISARDLAPLSLGERLSLPYRVYFPEPRPEDFDSFSRVQRLILHCIFTRHHDGFVRERHLRQLLDPVQEPWVAPYVVQLLGEPVVEILEVLENHLEDLTQGYVRAFVTENSGFLSLTKERVTSYWNCYHRARHPNRSDYVGFKLVRALEDAGRPQPARREQRPCERRD